MIARRLRPCYIIFSRRLDDGFTLWLFADKQGALYGTTVLGATALMAQFRCDASHGRTGWKETVPYSPTLVSG
jgi:hypothetical protein